jgi:hypothetical protein
MAPRVTIKGRAPIDCTQVELILALTTNFKEVRQALNDGNLEEAKITHAMAKSMLLALKDKIHETAPQRDATPRHGNDRGRDATPQRGNDRGGRSATPPRGMPQQQSVHNYCPSPRNGDRFRGAFPQNGNDQFRNATPPRGMPQQQSVHNYCPSPRNGAFPRNGNDQFRNATPPRGMPQQQSVHNYCPSPRNGAPPPFVDQPQRNLLLLQQIQQLRVTPEEQVVHCPKPNVSSPKITEIFDDDKQSKA